VLTDVLSLPWGVEIYGLDARWNPLNVRRPCRCPTTARTCSWSASARRLHLAHFLVNEGFGAVGVDA
jgi:hypothetical protein